MSLRLEMHPSVCRGCAKRLSDSNVGVEIFSQDTSSGFGKENNVRTGIELITGVSVSDSDGLPRRLCAECNKKLEEFLAFRTQLLDSLRVFRSSGYSSEKSEPGIIPSLSDLGETGQRNSEDRSAPGLNEEENIELEISDQENESTPAVGCGQTECSQELNKINVIDEDVESDIDVCSGEDYDVLELDVQSKKDEIYEIESSGESDIQVCDYEPSGL